MLDVKGLIAKLLNCDHVVEEGTSGGWTYRKWKSGVAECWRQLSISNVTFSAASPISGLYQSADMTVTFPFPFTEYPVTNVNTSAVAGDYGWIGRVGNGTSSIIVRAFKRSSTTGQVSLAISVKGKWK